MEPFSAENVKVLFKKSGFRPKKGLGQHFLTNKVIIGKLLAAAEIGQKDTVLEVGPGIGNLTGELAKWAKRVVAVEKDPGMVRALNEELRIKNIENVEVIHEDILKIFDPTTAPFQRAGLPSPFPRAAAKFPIPNSYKVVANIPYYLTAHLIRKFLEGDSPPKDMTLIVQKEVAKRICAKPPDANLLSISVQFYAQPKIIGYISKNSFWPRPKVDSAIIKITPYKASPYQFFINDEGFRAQFFKIVRAGFSQPRKQLINNLSKSLGIDKIRIKSWLSKNNIQPRQRAETLNIGDWIKLTKNFNARR